MRKVIPFLLALGLLACRIQVNLPLVQTVGPTVQENIVVPVPTGAKGSINLRLEFGGGTLKLHPGSDALVSGIAKYNVADLKPKVTSTGDLVRIEQGDWHVRGIPDWGGIENEWDFSLGSVPLDLSIKAGAYDAEYEFGGLSLTNLTIQDGASDTKMSFSSPNGEEMVLLRYETGASNVTLSGLANANFSTMEFSSGAGNYSLDFSGVLSRSASVYIKTGVSNLTLVIPNGIPVQVTVEGGLSNVSSAPGWTKKDNTYTQQGIGPSLTIIIEIGAGNLALTR